MLKFSNQLVNGDCLEEIKKIPDKTFDLIFADPPYNMQIGEKLTRPDASKVNGVNDKWDQFKSFNEYDEFCITWLNECKRVFLCLLLLSRQHLVYGFKTFPMMRSYTKFF